MQLGLHIGLASWIHQQRNTEDFPVFPSLLVTTELVDLESIQDVHDLSKTLEFSTLVNFIPRLGQVADAFSSSSILWRTHRDLLEQMDHAREALTSEEQMKYQAARDVLYTTDSDGRPIPSQKHLLYEELRNAYQDLVSFGGNSEEIAQTMADWLILGHKQIIEEAFETLNRLSNRSSRIQAYNECLSLNENPWGLGLRSHGNVPFAPVYFAPISALSRETWIKAEVSFADLDRAVGNNPPGVWRTYRANRLGMVLFDYVVLTIMRPWFTPSLYNADDWKLPDEASFVSKGNGSDGLLPAYVEAVYLVSVKNVQSNTNVQPCKPRPQTAIHQLAANQILKAGASKPIILGKLSCESSPSKGVQSIAVNTPRAHRTNLNLSTRMTSRPATVVKNRTSSNANFKTLDYGTVKRINSTNLKLRYLVAQAHLLGEKLEPTSTTENVSLPSQIYVAGFGCKKIPYSPNPNITYNW